ncbi:putative integral membrane protein [Rivularia sp. PCC 7116]|uniref:mannosyltransferase family protein n=1 Tax=Rivularia sp. PCC 7116 TaxID=373994 RepID=UPI00029F12D0|nr:mannosyltransferase family protein [Rivularia sp. PCC 7116]AFY53645.1 putative integral membrane protein [Rivularia sp. PCC 7116]
MTQSKNILNNVLNNGLVFATAMWLLSRIVIIVAMLLIAPLLPVAENAQAPIYGWDVFYAWDSIWYHRIVAVGYEFINDGKQYSVAFFPLLPLLTRVIMHSGLPFQVAATLINNVAFLGALIIFYSWVNESHGKNVARWSTAVLAWCPYSLYGTVIYTEGLFLLFSIAALRAFDKKQHLSAAVWGILSTATRITGVMLIPAFLYVAWKQGRSLKAYVAGLAVGSGAFLFSLYCLIKFGDALAFVHVQKGWRESTGFAREGWWNMLMQIAQSSPVLFGVIIVSGFLLWRFRQKLVDIKLRSLFYFLWLLLWLGIGEPLWLTQRNPFGKIPLVKMVIVFGGLSLLWRSRAKIPLVAVGYGFFSYALILNTGLTASVERYAYGIVSLSFALGLCLNRYRAWGYAITGFFAVLLASLAVQFAHNQWVA